MKTPSKYKKTQKKALNKDNMLFNENLEDNNIGTDIKEMFGDNNKKSESEIVKELFSEFGIRTKTEVSMRETSIIARLYYLASYTSNNRLKELLDTLLSLKVSHKRKSRKEFIDALKNLPSNELNFPSNLGGMK